MSLNWLKMNDAKTEFIYFGFPKQLEKAVVSEMSVGDSVVQRLKSMKRDNEGSLARATK